MDNLNVKNTIKENKTLNTKKKFEKEQLKTIAIIFLLFLVFCFLLTSSSDETSRLSNEIKDLNNQITSLTTEKENLNSQIMQLNKDLDSAKSQITTLENEKNELNSRIEELEKVSSTKNTTSTTSTATNNNSQMVWVGETGTKYHTQNCRTLKGKGHQITMQQALSEGKQPCKVCN